MFRRSMRAQSWRPTDFRLFNSPDAPTPRSKATPSRPFRVLRLSITSLHVFKIKERPQKQYTMVEAMADAPAPRKRGRPRAGTGEEKMRRFWCTSCFVGVSLCDALLFASSNLTNTNASADIKDISKWSWTSLVGSLGFDLLAVDVLLLVEA